MTIGSEIQLIWRLLPQHFERLLVLVLLMGGIYEVRHWDDVRCHGTHNRFHEYVAGSQKLVGVGVMLETHRQQGDLISLLLFFQN
jgi:hypothetical protein